VAFRNPPVPWRTVERALSGHPVRGQREPAPWADGGDSPAWSRHRAPYEAHAGSPEAARVAREPAVPYAELHCHSHFSFLDGSSSPEHLAETAAGLGLEALALTDHDGFYGVVRFAEAARAHGLSTVFGTELSLGLSAPQNGVADPEGQHLLVLARDLDGYARLSSAVSAAHLAGGQKGRPVYDLETLAEAAGGHWAVLTGGRKGMLRRALDAGGHDGAAAALDRLGTLFGREHVGVELTDHGLPTDGDVIDTLAELAERRGYPVVATNGVHYATPAEHRLAGAMAAVRARRSLDEMDGWLPPAGAACLRPGAEMAARFADRPAAIAAAAELGRDCAFDLKLLAPSLPPFDVPPGHTEDSWLRELVRVGALRRYGTPEQRPDAYARLEHELDVIMELRFPGYFLIVADIARFCHDRGILCQGRGSAATSAVCYAIAITNVDAVAYKLLFERFLAPERDGPPDIDIDIESDRREEAIQYVYEKYGRRHAAQVADVITYRSRSAVRDMAKALGFSTGQQDAWSRQIDGWTALAPAASGAAESATTGSGIPDPVLDLALEIQDAPRHLGIHSGGMVIADRPVAEVVPVEWARMANRSVLQWDKDDCARVGLVKFDMLGLGMLSALHYCLDLLAEFHGLTMDLHTIDLENPEIYAMLQRADSVGVFQVESRAQMATLPRLKPREFYDLVVEVALIRPGPIQGGSVHPYIRRRNKLEKVTFDHPLLENALGRTLGVPLFQEQLMQMAIDIAGFTAAEADQLRRAMGSKRSPEKMTELKDRLYAGMAERGVTLPVADKIFQQLLAFANFGFPESHSVSFASLVLYSSWFKRYYPAVFCAGLLQAQPMGFYSPQSLVADARRHGVVVRGPDVNASRAAATLEALTAEGSQLEPGSGDPESWGSGGPAVRLGLAAVRHIGTDLAERIEAERRAGDPYVSMPDLARRVGLDVRQTEALATAGAFGCFGLDRRAALWGAGTAAAERPDRLPGTASPAPPPALPGMDAEELLVADVWATGITPDSYPTTSLRPRLDAMGVLRSDRVKQLPHGRRVLVGGVVTHRQRPATAGGVTFVNLEDEAGMVNVICSRAVWARHRTVAVTSAGLLVSGRLERIDEGAGPVVNIVADRLAPLALRPSVRSRDFR
jgi:error-prone DNA polymerase